MIPKHPAASQNAMNFSPPTTGIPGWTGAAERSRTLSQIRRALAEPREDLRVTITLWDETTVTNVLGMDPAGLQLYERPSMREFYREAGIDITLYGDEPGLEVDRGMGNSRDRGGHGSKPCGGTTLPIEAQPMYRDFDYLDQEALDAFHDQDRPRSSSSIAGLKHGGNMCGSNLNRATRISPQMILLDGKPAEGILRLNSEYPKDGFWWNSQLRITPGFPTPLHFLEPYAHAWQNSTHAALPEAVCSSTKPQTNSVHSLVRIAHCPAVNSIPSEKPILLRYAPSSTKTSVTFTRSIVITTLWTSV